MASLKEGGGERWAIMWSVYIGADEGQIETTGWVGGGEGVELRNWGRRVIGGSRQGQRKRQLEPGKGRNRWSWTFPILSFPHSLSIIYCLLIFCTFLNDSKLIACRSFKHNNILVHHLKWRAANLLWLCRFLELSNYPTLLQFPKTLLIFSKMYPIPFWTLLLNLFPPPFQTPYFWL